MTPLPSIENCSPGTDLGAFVLNGQIILPWKLLADEYKIDWFCCQGALQDPTNGYDSFYNITEARKHVDVIGTFYWSNPGNTAQSEIDRFCKAIAVEKPDFWWLDVEQHVVNGVEVSPSKIADHAQLLFEGITARFPANQLRATFYTRIDFIKSYMPNIIPLLATLDHISIAAWPDYGLSVYYQELEDTYTGIMRECLDWAAPQPRPYKQINIFDGEHGPDLSLFPKVTVFNWQHSSRIKPSETVGSPLYDHGYDWDRMNINKAQLLKWVKFQPFVDPGPLPPSTEDRLNLLEKQIADHEKRIQELEARPQIHQSFIPIVTK